MKMENKTQIVKEVSGHMTDEFTPRKTFVRSIDGFKPVTVSWALNQLMKGGFVEQVLDEESGDKMVRLVKEFDDSEIKEDVQKLKRTPERRERKVLNITEEDAEGLGLLALRTPPVKANIEYPEGVSPEMYGEFKSRIINNAELLKDLVMNFNGAKGVAITMWDPEHKDANENGKVFYRWENPMDTWELMVQLCKVVELYEAQEAKAVEE